MCDILKIDPLITMSVAVPKQPTSDVVLTTPYHPAAKPTNKKGILLIGKPCSGKSVVSRRLETEFGARHYSSSRALRSYANSHNKPEIIKQMDNGDLVTDTHSIRLVSGWDYQDFLSHRPLGIFDGWGRTDDELLYALDRLKAVGDVQVVFLDGDTDCLIQRARDRNRGDDNLLLKRITGYVQFFDKLQHVAKKRLGDDRVHLLPTTELTEAQVFHEICSYSRLTAA